MTDIQNSLKEVLNELPVGVQLVAVSKFHPQNAIEEAYAVGQRIFGESHEQELQLKAAALPKDIQWHFIGHLQTNKVKYIAPYVSLIHAVDTFKLLREIDKQGAKVSRVIPCLLEMHVAAEATKYGFTFEECRKMLSDGEWRALSHVHICGLMCMASNVDYEAQIKNEFHMVKVFFDELKETYFADDDQFKERSWGMSHDYKLAIEEGSTMVRVGTRIFGARVY
jgi:pyridoxal phosphate enzyme (YggS family)